MTAYRSWMRLRALWRPRATSTPRCTPLLAKSLQTTIAERRIKRTSIRLAYSSWPTRPLASSPPKRRSNGPSKWAWPSSSAKTSLTSLSFSIKKSWAVWLAVTSNGYTTYWWPLARDRSLSSPKPSNATKTSSHASQPLWKRWHTWTRRCAFWPSSSSSLTVEKTSDAWPFKLSLNTARSRRLMLRCS